MGYSLYHYGSMDWITESTEKGEKLLAVEILGRLQEKKLFNLSATKIIHFGRILHKHQIPSKRIQTGTIYHVVEK